MQKKKDYEIIKYYRRKDVVSKYDKRRFSGVGGNYVNEVEVNIILNLIYTQKGGRVLDIGAGKGRLSINLKNAGFDVYCLDSSEEMVKYLSKEFPKKKIIIQSIFDRIKTKSRYDVITSLRFFDHFDIKDQEKIIKNIKPVLAKNGKIVFATLNKNSLESILSVFFPYGKVNYFYSETKYKNMFNKTGFKVERKKDAFFIPRGVYLKVKNSFLARILSFIDQLLSKLFPKMNSYQVYLLEKNN